MNLPKDIEVSFQTFLSENPSILIQKSTLIGG